MGIIKLITFFGEQIHLSFATTNCFPETSIARKCVFLFLFFFLPFFLFMLNESHAFIKMDNNETLWPGG